MEIISRPSHPASGVLPSRNFAPHRHNALDTPPLPPPLSAGRGRSMKFFRNHLLRFLLPLALAAGGTAVCAMLVPGETAAVKELLVGFPDADVQAHQARPFILAGLCFLPALAAFLYALGSTLDRYITRQFAGIFTVCLAALMMIWLLMDMADKIGDFRETQDVMTTIGKFYAARSPAILLLLLPYSLLLALLYALGKLSGSREIIAMIQAGRSVVRITLPLITAGLLFSLLGLGLNYHWAPAVESNVDKILAEASGKQAAEATQVLYRNAASRRLWMIGAFPQDYQIGKPLQDVEITTTREDKTLESRLCAKRAFWDRPSRRWTFEEAVTGNYPPKQAPVFETHAAPVTIDTWSETPWQLIKPGLSADLLDIPDLSSWLKAWSQNGQFADPSPYLTHWHYRWALPFACLVTVLLATPLGIHFSRRAPGGGIFLAVVLSALMMLISSITLALGESGTLRPAHAAWLPNIVFSLLGLYLFHRRISGQPIYLILRRLIPGND
jgi:lipopolysaccharide export system permease protein